MVSKDALTTHSRELESGKRLLYIIVTGVQHAVPLFRKLDKNRLAIIAWTDKHKAEQFIVANSLPNSSVLQVTHEHIIKFRDTLPITGRYELVLELK